MNKVALSFGNASRWTSGSCLWLQLLHGPGDAKKCIDYRENEN